MKNTALSDFIRRYPGHPLEMARIYALRNVYATYGSYLCAVGGYRCQTVSHFEVYSRSAHWLLRFYSCTRVSMEIQLGLFTIRQ